MGSKSGAATMVPDGQVLEFSCSSTVNGSPPQSSARLRTFNLTFFCFVPVAGIVIFSGFTGKRNTFWLGFGGAGQTVLAARFVVAPALFSGVAGSAHAIAMKRFSVSAVR